MARKPYTKIKLTDDEIELINFMIRTTGCDWFHNVFETDENGNQYDVCWDSEKGRNVSLQLGVFQLGEAYFEGGNELENGDTNDLDVWNNLCHRLGIDKWFKEIM